MHCFLIIITQQVISTGRILKPGQLQGIYISCINYIFTAKQFIPNPYTFCVLIHKINQQNGNHFKFLIGSCFGVELPSPLTKAGFVYWAWTVAPTCMLSGIPMLMIFRVVYLSI